mmetsp:Transcript_13066/g.31931  ORF Transcript_13066/g.31931 Transcript_13066/m.31931 type:complete len:214 (-) Transcript_13066:452-1093(-)
MSSSTSISNFHPADCRSPRLMAVRTAEMNASSSSVRSSLRFHQFSSSSSTTREDVGGQSLAALKLMLSLSSSSALATASILTTSSDGVCRAEDSMPSSMRSFIASCASRSINSISSCSSSSRICSSRWRSCSSCESSSFLSSFCSASEKSTQPLFFQSARPSGIHWSFFSTAVKSTHPCALPSSTTSTTKSLCFQPCSCSDLSSCFISWSCSV